MPKLSRRQRQVRQIQCKRRRAGQESGIETTSEEYTTHSASSVSDNGENGLRDKLEEDHTHGLVELSSDAELKIAVPCDAGTKPTPLQPRDVWVMCNKCQKWRRLDPSTNVKKLPKKWFCSMNTTDPARQLCSAPEEDYSAGSEHPSEATQEPVPISPRSSMIESRIREICAIWKRRLCSSDKAEAREAAKKAKTPKEEAVRQEGEENEWVRCCNPACGKWRCLPRFIERGSVGTRNKPFYCSMNYWDETVASCSVPQDPLWECQWNLKRIINRPEADQPSRKRFMIQLPPSLQLNEADLSSATM